MLLVRQSATITMMNRFNSTAVKSDHPMYDIGRVFIAHDRKTGAGSMHGPKQGGAIQWAILGLSAIGVNTFFHLSNTSMPYKQFLFLEKC